MLQPIQTALPGILPLRVPATAETAAAIPGAAAGDGARADLPQDRGAEAGRLAQAARELLEDPARPLGPPPAFEANVLEAERARLRYAGPAAAAEAGAAGATPDPASGPAPDPAPDPAPEAPCRDAARGEAAYREATAGPAPSRLDLSR
ncbi:MAG: hypothetical protein N2Z62_06980 [Rhodobacteraceae bacterium]|nr:hypothetical protein [Paracoccaceae bacterium]